MHTLSCGLHATQLTRVNWLLSSHHCIFHSSLNFKPSSISTLCRGSRGHTTPTISAQRGAISIDDRDLPRDVSLETSFNVTGSLTCAPSAESSTRYESENKNGILIFATQTSHLFLPYKSHIVACESCS